jgi:hypothetical protein
MTAKDHSVDELDRLITDVLGPVVRIASELDAGRQLAMATLNSLESNQMSATQAARVREGQVRRSVLPHYAKLREHYMRYETDLAKLSSVPGAELLATLAAREDGSLLYGDSEAVSTFVTECEAQLNALSARFRELTY